MTTEQERTEQQSPDVATYSLWSIPREAWPETSDQLKALTSFDPSGTANMSKISSSTEARMRSFKTQLDETVLRMRVD